MNELANSSESNESQIFGVKNNSCGMRCIHVFFFFFFFYGFEGFFFFCVCVCFYLYVHAYTCDLISILIGSEQFHR